MKNRPFFIAISIVLAGSVGLAIFLFIIVPHGNHGSVTIYSLPAPTDKRTEFKSSLGMATRSSEELSTHKPNSSSIQANNQKIGQHGEMQDWVTQHQQILNSEAYQIFMETQEQEWTDAINHGEIPDFAFQDTFDFLASQGGRPVDFAKEALEMFQEFFPRGAPEDYDAEMASRLWEVLAAARGDIEEAAVDAIMTLGVEPDFGAWMLGRFEGDVGQTVRWFMDQARMFDSETPPTPRQENSLARTARSNNDPLTRRNVPAVKSVENRDASISGISADVPLSTVQEASMRETLTRYDTDEGLRYLLETDKDAADWLDSPDATKTRVSEKENDARPPEARSETDHHLKSHQRRQHHD